MEKLSRRGLMASAAVAAAVASASSVRAGQTPAEGASGAGILRDKVAVITGAARGIGRATAVAFAREGADVIGVDICAMVDPRSGVTPSTPEDLEETGKLVGAAGRRWLGMKVDTRDLPALREAAAKAEQEFGGVDILFANAGIQQFHPLLEMEDADWNITIDVNVTGTANTLRAFAPSIVKRGGGRIILTSSTQGEHGTLYASAYSASKWAIIGLMKSAALELGRHKITVNALIPGLIDTPSPATRNVTRERSRLPAGLRRECSPLTRKLHGRVSPAIRRLAFHGSIPRMSRLWWSFSLPTPPAWFRAPPMPPRRATARILQPDRAKTRPERPLVTNLTSIDQRPFENSHRRYGMLIFPVTAVAIVLSCGAAIAQTSGSSEATATLSTRHVLTLDVARHVLAAAEAEARQHNWPGAIAIVDAEGYLITSDRMDGSPMLASVELAPAKARTAALFGKPSKALEDAIHSGRYAAVTSGFVEMVGGVPLVVDGEEVGAIGVSTAQPDWDIQIAAAGAASLARQP